MSQYMLLSSGQIIIHKSGVPGHVFGTVLVGGKGNIEYNQGQVIRKADNLSQLIATRSQMIASGGFPNLAPGKVVMEDGETYFYPESDVKTTINVPTKSDIYSSIYQQSKAEHLWTPQEKATVQAALNTAQSTMEGIRYSVPKSQSIAEQNLSVFQPRFVSKGSATTTTYPPGSMRTVSTTKPSPYLPKSSGYGFIPTKELRETEKDTVKVLGNEFTWWSESIPYKQRQYRHDPTAVFGLSVLSGTKQLKEFATHVVERTVAGHPEEPIVDLVGGTIMFPYTTVKSVQEKGPLITFGEIAPMLIATKGVSKGFEYVPKPKVAKFDVATDAKVKDMITGKMVDETVKARTFGLEVGTRSVPLLSWLGKELFLGYPKIKEFIIPKKGTEMQMSASALEAKLQAKMLGREEMFKLKTKAVRAFGEEKGMKVEEPIFDVGLKKPIESSKIINQLVAEVKGIFFGSALYKQLARKFRVKMGDVDIFVPNVVDLIGMKKLTTRVVERLRAAGENVEVSPRNVGIIQTPKGKKVLEFKTGKELDRLLSGSEPGPAGIAGFAFPNIRAGQMGKTIKFGQARAIWHGEQFMRKFAGDSFIRGKTTAEEAPKGLRGAGIFPKGRRAKDTADFYISGLGLAEYAKTSKLLKIPGIKSLKLRKITKGEKALKESFLKYTPEQRADIARLIRKRITGQESGSKEFFFPKKKITMRSLLKEKSSSVISKGVKSGSLSSLLGKPKKSVYSSTSKASSMKSLIGSPSKASSYKSSYKSVSSIFSKLESKSPYKSKYKSPSPSLFKSRSPSKYGSPYSPSGYGSGYGSSYSPPSSFPDITKITKLPKSKTEDAIFKSIKGKRREKIKKKYKPSLYALEFGIKATKPPKFLTGTEIRPMLWKKPAKRRVFGRIRL